MHRAERPAMSGTPAAGDSDLAGEVHGAYGRLGHLRLGSMQVSTMKGCWSL